MPSILSLRIFTSRPGSRLRFFIKIEIQYQQILQKVQNSVPHDYIKSCTVFVYTVVQQYVLVDYCCFHLTSGASTAVGPYIIPRNRKGLVLSQTTLREKFVEKKFQVFDYSRPFNHSSKSEPLPRWSEFKSRGILESVVVVFFPLTDRASTIPSNIRGCQSSTWSQRGTKVNGSHIMVTTRYSDQQGSKSRQTVMRLYKRWHRPSNKTVHQASFTPYREQPRLTRIVVAYPRPAFSATNQANTFQPF